MEVRSNEADVHGSGTLGVGHHGVCAVCTCTGLRGYSTAVVSTHRGSPVCMVGIRVYRATLL